MSELFDLTVNAVSCSKSAFCRYITANDTGKTGSHQYGFFVPKYASSLLFDEPGVKGDNKEAKVKIEWQGCFTTESRFIYYGKGTRNEYRITRFGADFPFLQDEYIGSLMVLVKHTNDYYMGFVLSSDEDIENFFSYYNISPTQPNRLIKGGDVLSKDDKLSLLLKKFIGSYTDFPETKLMALGARECFNNAFSIEENDICDKPDAVLLKWVETEYSLFQNFEDKFYEPILKTQFLGVKEFVEIANQILNRRKSRAGKSLEHHLASIFDANKIVYEKQVVTENRKTPDFIFPNGKCYHNFEFPSENLISLAAKTTCKDRWRQIITEADRIDEKHLFTLQCGITSNQLKEMAESRVKLVVPEEYRKSFPSGFKDSLLNLSQFIGYVKRNQENIPKHFLMK